MLEDATKTKFVLMENVFVNTGTSGLTEAAAKTLMNAPTFKLSALRILIAKTHREGMSVCANKATAKLERDIRHVKTLMNVQQQMLAGPTASV